MTNTYTVLGASGNVGKPVALALLAAGHHVRVVLRNVDSDAAKALKNAGATLLASGYVEGDEKLGTLSIDETILTQAFTGVDGAFALIPPNLTSTNPDEEAGSYVALLKRAVVASKLKKLVILSSIGAHLTSSNGAINKIHSFEETLKPLAGPQFRLVIVRSGFFFANLRFALNAASTGVVAFPYAADTRLNMVSTEDVGEEIAKSLMDDHHHGSQVIEVAGPKDLTFAEVTAIVSEQVGKELAYVQVLDKIVEISKSRGMSQLGAESIRDMVISFCDGTLVYEHPEKVVRGKRTAQDYFKANLKQ